MKYVLFIVIALLSLIQCASIRCISEQNKRALYEAIEAYDFDGVKNIVKHIEHFDYPEKSEFLDYAEEVSHQLSRGFRLKKINGWDAAKLLGGTMLCTYMTSITFVMTLEFLDPARNPGASVGKLFYFAVPFSTLAAIYGYSLAKRGYDRTTAKENIAQSNKIYDELKNVPERIR